MENFEINEDDIGFVYTLRLKNEKYYVGFTKNIQRRIFEHIMGEMYGGARFTSKYKPVEVLSVRRGTKFLEEAQTALYMSRYGWENVRGGSFFKVDLASCPSFMIAKPKQEKIRDEENK